MIKSQREAIDKFILKNVGSRENLDQSNEYLNSENHVRLIMMKLMIQLSLMICQMYLIMKFLALMKNNQFPH